MCVSVVPDTKKKIKKKSKKKKIKKKKSKKINKTFIHIFIFLVNCKFVNSISFCELCIFCIRHLLDFFGQVYILFFFFYVLCLVYTVATHFYLTSFNFF